jgi:DNA topoisomerase III
MESRMKDICEGRRTKDEVVQESIMMYREVFMKANREINVLVEVLVIFYREADLDMSTISQLD